MKRILAIDPGTKCGYALYDNGAIVSGVWDLRIKRNEGNGMRFIRLGNFLRETMPVDICGFEEVMRHLSTDSAHVYGGITAVIMAICETRKVPYVPVPVGTIKKHATGKGNANKEAMIEAAGRLYPGRTIADDNEADALCILSYLVKEYANA
jgi:Holliday junction resolvasome RuvABC endonuclease subunit